MKATGHRWAFIALVALLTFSILAGCTPNANDLILSPDLGSQIAARDAGAVVTVAKPELKNLADLTDAEKYAGLPPEVMDVIHTVNPADAEAIRTKYACVGCHSLDGTALAGPTWKNLGNTAVNRVKGESPALYLYQSITEPGAYVVEGYIDGVMPKTFKDQMSPEELATVIQFILEQTN